MLLGDKGDYMMTLLWIFDEINNLLNRDERSGGRREMR